MASVCAIKDIGNHDGQRDSTMKKRYASALIECPAAFQQLAAVQLAASFRSPRQCPAPLSGAAASRRQSATAGRVRDDVRAGTGAAIVEADYGSARGAGTERGNASRIRVNDVSPFPILRVVNDVKSR